jgi:hypothetical protein
MDSHMQDIENNEARQSRMRPGFSDQIINNQKFTAPTVFGPEPGLSLAMRKKPDLSQAREMPGGVSTFIGHFGVWGIVRYIAIYYPRDFRQLDPDSGLGLGPRARLSEMNLIIISMNTK